MDERLYIRELPCYSKATEEQKQKLKTAKDLYFDFSKVENIEIRNCLKAFVIERSAKLSVITLRYDLRCFNVLCDFLCKASSIEAMSEEDILRKFKAYLLVNKYGLTKKHFRKNRGVQVVEDSDLVKYMVYFLRTLLKREICPDIWDLKQMGNRKINPIKPTRHIDFGNIMQEQIKDETKEAIKIQNTWKSSETLRLQLLAVNRFAKFLNENFKNVSSFVELTRIHIEAYLLYVKAETGLAASSYTTELSQLRTVISEVARLKDCLWLDNLFLSGDSKDSKVSLPKTYTRNEIRRFNEHLTKLDVQLARCILLHQLLGLRISDTLTLKTDCIYYDNKKPVIRIKQYKSSYYEKPISNDVVKLIQKAIEHTQMFYGRTTYIFVCGINPERPYTYSMIEYQVKALIRDNDIFDDNGKLFTFNTHMFRRTYAQQLTEQHLDDFSISKLLGHSNVRTVHRYRRLSNAKLAEETKEFRKEIDKIIIDITAGWEI